MLWKRKKYLRWFNFENVDIYMFMIFIYTAWYGFTNIIKLPASNPFVISKETRIVRMNINRIIMFRF